MVCGKRAGDAKQDQHKYSLLRCLRRKEHEMGRSSSLDLELLETGDKISNDFQNDHLYNAGQTQFGRDGQFQGMKHGIGCQGNVCHGAMMNKSNGPAMSDGIDANPSVVWDEAKSFLKQFYVEAATVPSMRRQISTSLELRLKEVRTQIRTTGTYSQTFAELEYGARLAWRNEGRCINRKVWDQLQLLDRRHESSPKQLFEGLLDHVDAVWNGGALSVAISIFKPKAPGKRGCEFVSSQMYRFAAYPVEDGGVLGDPANLALTELCLKCGWQAPPVSDRTPWDLLPMLIADEKGRIEVFELPQRFKEAPYIVHLTHPDPNMAEAVEIMGLRWCAIPVLTTFTLWCGGVAYQCCPFSGWFMQTEVARDLADVQRYNILPRLVDELDLPDRTAMYPLDSAFLELNRAITHSFQEQRIAIADHQNTSRAFCEWFKGESKRAPVPGDWVWLVPPIGGSTCPVFHQEMLNFRLTPAYMFNEDRVKQALAIMPDFVTGLKITTEQAQADAALARRRHMPSIQVLVGSQTGTCERLASNYARAVTKRGAHCSCHSLAAFMDMETTQIISAKIQDVELPPPLEAVVVASPDVDTMQERLCGVDVLYTKLLEMGASQKMLLILCSTTGQGQFPGNAHAFAQACLDLNHLAKKHLAVTKMCNTLRKTGLQYAVCGFGSTSYLKFNQAAIDLEASLCELLGDALMPLGACDAQKKQAHAWAEWYKKLDEVLFREEDARPAHPCPTPGSIVRWTGEAQMPCMRTYSGSKQPRTMRPRSSSLNSVSKFSMSVAAERRPSYNRTGISHASLHMSPADDTDTRWDKQAVVTSTRHVFPKSASSSMIEVEFQVMAQVVYKPGDYVEVLPTNPEAMAEELLVELGLKSKMHSCFICQDTAATFSDDVSVEELETTGRFPENTTLLQAFVRVLDICGPPPPGLLVYFAYVTRDANLDVLAEGRTEYADWVEQEKPLLLDIVRRFRISCVEGPNKVPLEAFLEELPHIKRRTYSISSRAQESTGRTKFTVTATVNTFHASLGPRIGLSSGYLHALRELDSATVRFRDGKHLNLEGVTRLFLIGSGSGIGPLRAFWQEFLSRSGAGRIVLFQGCRSPAEQPYAEEIAAAVRGGRLESHVACSRQEPRRYVQHALAAYPKLWEALQDPGARFFVCGATRVAQSVRKVLVATGENHGLSSEDAFKFVLNLSDEHRYVEDVFGGPEASVVDSQFPRTRIAVPSPSECRYARSGIRDVVVSGMFNSSSEAARSEPRGVDGVTAQIGRSGSTGVHVISEGAVNGTAALALDVVTI